MRSPPTEASSSHSSNDTSKSDSREDSSDIPHLDPKGKGKQILREPDYEDDSPSLSETTVYTASVADASPSLSSGKKRKLDEGGSELVDSRPQVTSPTTSPRPTRRRRNESSSATSPSHSNKKLFHLDPTEPGLAPRKRDIEPVLDVVEPGGLESPHSSSTTSGATHNSSGFKDSRSYPKAPPLSSIPTSAASSVNLPSTPRASQASSSSNPGPSSSTSSLPTSSTQASSQPQSNSQSKPKKDPLASYICPICYSPPSCPTVTPCGHILCGDCLFTAVKSAIQRSLHQGPLNSGAKCPVCRAAIPGWDGRGGGVVGLRPKVKISCTFNGLDSPRK